MNRRDKVESTVLPLSRRRFLSSATTAGLVTAIAPHTVFADNGSKRPSVCVYTEHFQSLPIPKVCQLFKEMGVEGLDLTVRPGGHIDPNDVKTELPKAVAATNDHGLRIMMLTTGITAPDRQAEDILATCQKLGIDRIKMGYYGVGEFGRLATRLDDVRKQLDAVVRLAAKYGVRPCVHVHSGSTIPSNGFMLYQLIQDIDPKLIGAYMDSYHMTMTGGAGGWKQAIDLLSPWMSLVALKNFEWKKHDRTDLGQQKWGTDYCRLEDGVAPIPDFVRTIHRAGYRGFYTLHTEYRRPVKDCIEWTKDDFAFLKKVFETLPAS